MATLNKLSARFVQTETKPGRYADGGGLYLHIRRGGSKNWVMLYRWQSERPELGLGVYPIVSLSDARTKAAPLIAALHDRPKRDPRDVLKDLEAQLRPAPTFADVAADILPAIVADLKNDKHKAQWYSTLEAYTKPIAEKPIDKIETADVLACIRPIWDQKQETARRTLGRIERILDAAKAQGLRTGENPARWRGHMALLLPNKRKASHHKALPWADLPAFWSALEGKTSTAAASLAFTILTATRSSEGRGARWDEVDFKEGVWTVPAERMKAKTEHRVPLSRQAIALLQTQRDYATGPFIFSGSSPARFLSEAAVRKLLAELNSDQITTHGFRSTFKDWATDQTTFPDELSELCLAHKVGDATRRAYARSDGLERRRAIMQAWADHATGAATGKVLHIKAAT